MRRVIERIADHPISRIDQTLAMEIADALGNRDAKLATRSVALRQDGVYGTLMMNTQTSNKA